MRSLHSMIVVVAAMLLCLRLAAEAPSRPGNLTAVEVSSQAGVTRVTVMVSGLIDIKADRIENPARIFVDFASTVPMLSDGKGGRGILTIPAGDAILKQVRVAENQKGVTRLVFDLEQQNVQYRTSVLKNPNRLLIELLPARQDAQLRNPLATAQPALRVTPNVQKLTTVITTAMKSSFRMPDPPMLPASTFRLPKAEATQMPYRVSNFGMPELRWKQPPIETGRRATPAIAASRLGAGRQSLTRVLGLKIGRVVIDPGHGGHDVGCTGTTGLLEKDVVLDIGKRLGLLIEDGLGSEVIFTRKDDSFIVLDQRPVIANESRADLYISIHANSSPARTASGVETYYLNFTSSPEALEVAARENASSGRGVSDLGDLIKKIALKDKIDESREFAGKIQTSLHSGSSKAGVPGKDRGVRKAPFIVLIGAQMPSVLTEIGFLSNSREEALLRKPEYRQKIAESIYRGLAQYAGTLSHFTVAQNAAGN